ncbi:MAG: hypothetical protein JSR86_03100 [Proteobacteria bacterium]|nr:hypothetical protein [Pseudomonadota bacterium]
MVSRRILIAASGIAAVAGVVAMGAITEKGAMAASGWGPRDGTAQLTSGGCQGPNAERYWLSSRCDPAEHARAQAAIARLRAFYVSVGGPDQAEARMLDSLVAGRNVRFYPPGEMPNGDLGNYSPVAPFRVLMLNAGWLDNIEGRENPRLKADELVADMAGTIFHENIHKGQSVIKYASPYYRETEAWGTTLDRMARWIDHRLQVLDTITDPVKFQAEQKLIDGLFGAWLSKAGPELFDMVNQHQIDSLPFKGPCGVTGHIIGNADLNVARKAIKACRERTRARLAPGTQGPVRQQRDADKRPLDDLVMRFPFFSIADIRDQDRGRVCNTGISVGQTLLEASGRADLADRGAYPMVTVQSAHMDGDLCRIRVNFQRYTPPGVTVECAVSMVEFNTEFGRAIAIRGGGGRCG